MDGKGDRKSDGNKTFSSNLMQNKCLEYDK